MGAVFAGYAWLYRWNMSLHPQKTALARAVHTRLHHARGEKLITAVQDLSDDEFRSYFTEYNPPARITHPAEARAYADDAYRKSRPFLLWRENTALVALAEVYRRKAERLT